MKSEKKYEKFREDILNDVKQSYTKAIKAPDNKEKKWAGSVWGDNDQEFPPNCITSNYRFKNHYKPEAG